MTRKRLCALLFWLTGFVVVTPPWIEAQERARSEEGGVKTARFPFVLPWDDAAPSVANLSAWLPKPAGKFGHVRAGADGHLMAGDRRIRFFGVDLAFSANIPRHEDARKIAARMAKFGINIVRFHIMDMRRFPDGILARNATNTYELEPEALERLDYFTSQLQRNGIYIKLCLLNYRPLCAADGLPPEIERAGAGPFQQRHTVGFFHAKVLETQKEYARRLLTHRNIHTGKTYAEDTAVAFVEINNENGLIHSWLGDKVDTLPEVFLAELARQWNQWLLARYGTTEKLRQAWAKDEQPLGRELVANGDFTQQLQGWTLERHGSVKAAATVTTPTTESPSGLPAACIQVTRPGTQDWHIRFQQPGLPVQADRACTVTFYAKADRACTLHFSIEQAHAPWRTLGRRTQVTLSTAWQPFRFVLPIRETDDRARLVFDPAAKAGNYFLAGVSMRPGGVAGLAPEERPEKQAVPAFVRACFAQRTPEAQRDWIRFLWQTENRYWQAMNHFLKEDLHVQSLVIGTCVGCSTPNLMAGLDCVDGHAYWQHPVFPGRPWDPEDWFVRNESMVNDRGGILSGLALRQVLGKPFCVTEYGHPSPNTFVSEGHPLRAAYAALQDWDYTSASRYSHSDRWNLAAIDNFFDIHQHPTKMATLVPAAAMVLRGDVKPARQLVVAALGREEEIDRLRGAHAWRLVDAGDVGVPRETALVHRVAIAVEGQSVPAGALRPEQVQAVGDRLVSDTEELAWDLREPRRGVVTINTDRSKAVIGFGGGKRFDLAGVVVEPGPTSLQGWSAITLTAMEGDFRGSACRALITATGNAENTGMVWKDPEKSSVGKNWGGSPTLVEGIPARIVLPFSARSLAAWSLDERGQRKASLPVETDARGNAVLAIGPQWRTIWYEIVAK